MLRVGVLGPTGYTGLELLRILLGHPHAGIAYLGSRREARPHIADVWPALRGRLDMTCSLLGRDPVPDLDVAFLALPHTVSMTHVPPLLDRGIKVVDLGADYRLKDPHAFRTWYGAEHTDPANLARAVYGLTELCREEVAGAELVANPGCYPTAAILAVAPILKAGLLAEGAVLVVDAKSGLTGAGRTPKPELHFPEANENLAAYQVGTHRHTPEMLLMAARLAGRQPEVLFVPHLVPMDRGILATCYVPLSRPANQDELLETYRRAYGSEPFVRLRQDDSLPTTKDVWGTNFCDLAVRAFGRVAVVVACIDNLVKGAAGQAVQNMNVMAGLEETAGLLAGQETAA